MWFYGHFLTVLIFLKQHFSAVEPSAPPAPVLIQTATRGSSVELVCRAPHGHAGLEFKLFKLQQLIETIKHLTEIQEAHFTLSLGGNDKEKENHYCCQYENSMYSMYMQPKLEAVDASLPPSPRLVVEPPDEHVVPGQKLSFHCQAPDDPQKQSPKAFLLLRRAKGGPGSMITPAKLVSQSQESHFSLTTEGQEDGGEYVCLYQLKVPKTVNSTASQPVHITVIELPVPTLSLFQHEDKVLECVGSPAYPKAFFSLFRVGFLSPHATHQALLTQHSAKFPIPARYEHGMQYQCQYSVSLAHTQAYSKMSTPLSVPCITGYHECTQASTGNTDLALIVGSVSAGVLFIMVVSLLGFAVHSHVKDTTERRRQREQEMFWQHVHFTDHIVDLNLQRVDFGSEDTERRTLQEKKSISEPIYDYPMSTFKNPSFL